MIYIQISYISVVQILDFDDRFGLKSHGQNLLFLFSSTKLLKKVTGREAFFLSLFLAAPVLVV
jgi:hypothetical protein